MSCLNILIWQRTDYGTTAWKKTCLLILNWVYHANVGDYRNYTLIWHTCLEIPELTQTWLRNYGPKKNAYVDFELLRQQALLADYRNYNLFWNTVPEHWTSWSGKEPTTELQAEKKCVCWFWTGSTMQMLVTTGTTPWFDTHALKFLNSHKPDYGTTGQKKTHMLILNS